MISTINKKKFYIISALSFICMIFFSFLPPIGDITPIGMRALGIFIGCMIGWIAGYIITTSLLGLTVYALYMPGESFATMLSGMFGNTNMLMIASSLLFAYAVQESGLMNYISQKLLATKFAKKSPWHLSVIMWISATVSTIFIINSFAVLVLIFALYYEIVDKLNIERKSPYVAFTLIGMAILASISVGVAPYSSAVLMCIAIMSNIAPECAYSIPLISFINLILVMSVFVIICVVSKFLFKRKMNPNINFEYVDFSNETTKVKFTKEMTIAVIGIVMLLAILILPYLLSADNLLYIFLNRIGGVGCFMFVSVVLAFIIINEKQMFNLEEAMTRACSWEVVFLLGTALYVSSYITSDESGVISTLSNTINSFVGDKGVYFVAILILLGGLILTNLASNVATTQLITPIFTIALINFDINPAIAVGLLAVVLDHGLIFPSGSAIGAFLHANKEWLTTGQVLKYTTFGAVSLMLATAVVGLPLALHLA